MARHFGSLCCALQRVSLINRGFSSWHRDCQRKCRLSGLATSTFNPNSTLLCLKYLESTSEPRTPACPSWKAASPWYWKTQKVPAPPHPWLLLPNPANASSAKQPNAKLSPTLATQCILPSVSLVASSASLRKPTNACPTKSSKPPMVTLTFK